MFDGAAFGQEMVAIVRGYVATEIESLRAENTALAAENKALAERLAALEAREMPDVSAFLDAEGVGGIVKAEIAAAIAGLPTPEKGEPGEVDMVAVAAMIEAAVVAEVAALPPVEPLAPDMNAVREIVDELTQQAVSEQLPEAVKAIPAPEKGDPGRDVDMDEVASLIEQSVKSAVDALPAPKDGEPGKDGLGLANALIDREGCLVVTFTDGSDKNLGRVVGKDGDPGKDGHTFTLDDFDIEPIDERTIRMGFTHGDVKHSFELEFPVPVYRGVWKEGQYDRGDMVTWGGDLWHAERATSQKPATDDWRLAVRKGRDAKP